VRATSEFQLRRKKVEALNEIRFRKEECWQQGGRSTKLMTPDDMHIRRMTRDELDTLVEWAAGEGWNPGLDDADVFWNTDPDGFVAAEIGGELVGGGSVVAYDKRYGFMGFFIMRPDCRRRGLGDRLWNERKRRLLARLDAGASIAMDGVFNMQEYYARGGFRFVCRDLRFEGRGMKSPQPEGIVEASSLPFERIDAYDRRHFPAPRSGFLRSWIQRPGGHALAVVGDDAIRGYGVMRPCRTGHKIGPLFAANASMAEQLLTAFGSRVPGEPIFLDVPEINRDALGLVAHHGMKEVFGCARMVLGPIPKLPDDEIFGVTTFELG
jgi:ribosomal protein S18 acetylase RimI-like enzyme